MNEDKNSHGIIYKIICKSTGLAYIGQTVQELKIRISQHKDQRSYCRCLSDAIKKYGWNNFEVVTLWKGHSKLLSDMENKFISEHNTLVPNGYNLREGGGKSEKVSEESRKLMIEKQREISKRRHGLLGTIKEIKSKVNGKTLSWSLKGHRDGKSYTIANCKTKEEILEFQREFTKNPDEYEIPKPKQISPGYTYQKDRKKWYLNVKSTYLGRYDTEEDARNALIKYKEDPHNFVKPCK